MASGKDRRQLMDSIYLDYNSTTPVDPRVVAAISRSLEQSDANPASQHQHGRRARQKLEADREQIAAVLGADLGAANADRLIFTSGGTESNNLALRGMVSGPPGRIVISAIEHPSVAGAAQWLTTRGFEVCRLPVNRHGQVLPEKLDPWLSSDTQLVSVMLGNNETGVLQPITEIVQRCRAAGIPVHTDAVQVVGKIPVNFRELGVDALTFTAHKFHGPTGIGGLLLSGRTRLEPLLVGGFQQAAARPGTESVPLVAGLRAAVDAWQLDAESRTTHMLQLRDRLERRLLADPHAQSTIHGIEAPRLPHTTNVSFPGLDRQALLMALDQAGVSCSTGSACASGSSEPSPVLIAMGLPEAQIQSALRISLGVTTTAEEVDRAAERILLIVKHLRQ